ncbi:MAG: secretin N-terminal domain-containing protein [Gammaproteobacteria bacterium]
MPFTRRLPRTPLRASFLLVLLAGLAVGVTARAQDLQVIDLRHRFADEVIPILQPLVEPGGVLTGTDNKLFLRASAANVAQIREALAAIDRAPRQLLITVGQGTISDANAAGVRGGVTINGGDIQVGVNRPPGAPSGADVQIRADSRQANLHNVSSVQTLEGSETLISVGTSTIYRDVATGFYATPRVNGDLVVLEISPRQQHFRPGGRGIVDSSGATTTVSGRLGQWLELGAVRESSSGSTSGLLVWGRRTGSSEYSAWVKVEETPAR